MVKYTVMYKDEAYLTSFFALIIQPNVGQIRIDIATAWLLP